MNFDNIKLTRFYAVYAGAIDTLRSIQELSSNWNPEEHNGESDWATGETKLTYINAAANAALKLFEEMKP